MLVDGCLMINLLIIIRKYIRSALIFIKKKKRRAKKEKRRAKKEKRRALNKH